MTSAAPEYLPHLLVHDEVHVALPVPRLHIHKPVPFPKGRIFTACGTDPPPHVSSPSG